MKKIKKLVSIIIVNWNRANDLKECLFSLLNQTYPHKEIIVIDNGSTDNSVNMIKTEFKQVRLLQNTTNLGAAFARNQGIKVSKGEFLWFLDNDSICPDPYTLQNLYTFFTHHNNVGAVGGELLYHQYIKGFIVKLNGDAVPKIKKDNTMECDYIDTLNLFTSFKIIYKIHGFNPYYVYLAEDKDICIKMKRIGLKIFALKKGAVIHKKSNINRPTTLKYKLQLEKNRIRFVLFNHSPSNIALTCFLDSVKLLDPRKILVDGISLYLKRFISISYGYFFNLLHLPKTIILRYVNPNFVNITNV